MSFTDTIYKVTSTINDRVHDELVFQLIVRSEPTGKFFDFHLGSKAIKSCATVSFQQKGKGDLSNLFYDNKCTQNGDLERGSFGTIVMINTILYCVARLYPYEI